MKIRYLGTTGFVIEASDGHTLVFDPYVSRPGMFEFLFKPIQIKKTLIDELIPRADDVLIGHSHIDHVLDAPYLCQKTDSRLIGGASTCHVGRAGGLPESQLVEIGGRETFQSGPFSCTAIPSQHGQLFGKVPLPGVMTEPPPWPPRYKDLLCGEVFNYHIEVDGKSLMYIDSADFFQKEFEGMAADVVCLCAAGRKWRPNLVSDAVKYLKPEYMIPSHWDWFFTDIKKPAVEFPGIGLKQFVGEMEKAGTKPVVLQFNEIFEV